MRSWPIWDDVLLKVFSYDWDQSPDSNSSHHTLREGPMDTVWTRTANWLTRHFVTAWRVWNDYRGGRWWAKQIRNTIKRNTALGILDNDDGKGQNVSSIESQVRGHDMLQYLFRFLWISIFWSFQTRNYHVALYKRLIPATIVSILLQYSVTNATCRWK